jgi:hypothetical protein
MAGNQMTDQKLAMRIRDAWQFPAFRLNVLALILVTANICFFAYAVFDRDPPYKYDIANSFVMPDPAETSDQMLVKWKLAEQPKRLCPGATRRELFDPATKIILVTYDPAPTALAASIRDGYLNITFALPKVLPYGKIGYRATVRYQCNWLQRLFPDAFAFDVTTPPLFFTVQP